MIFSYVLKGMIIMALFDSGSNEQKQRKKQAEKILDEIVGGLMPTRTRVNFFNRMRAKGIKPRHQEKVRSIVLNTIKYEVENYELEPTMEAINQRIEQIIIENVDPKEIEKRRVAVQKAESKKIIKKSEIEEKFGVDLNNKLWFQCSIEEIKYSTFTNQPMRNIDTAYVIISEDNFEIIKSNFRNIKSELNKRNINEVDGILFDLGVSSPQLDVAERGFSYHEDARLDMRMDKENPISAYEVVNNYSESDLITIFFRYGEERYSKSIARKIVEYRKEKKVETTLELVEIIKSSMPFFPAPDTAW